MKSLISFCVQGSVDIHYRGPVFPIDNDIVPFDFRSLEMVPSTCVALPTVFLVYCFLVIFGMSPGVRLCLFSIVLWSHSLTGSLTMTELQIDLFHALCPYFYVTIFFSLLAPPPLPPKNIPATPPRTGSPLTVGLGKTVYHAWLVDV